MNHEEQNKILKSHGYRWEKITQDWLDDNDDFETAPGWYLYAPNGRGEVSVSQAMAEIERGVDVVAAEIRAERTAEFEREALAAEMKSAKRNIANIIMRDGQRPDGDNNPSGEKVLDTQNIYGGGDWFVIGETEIWYCKNNGMDGDNWSHNNVRTGGAGAIGYAIPFDTEIADALQAIVDNVVFSPWPK